MQIDNPTLLLHHTPPLCVMDEALKFSASGGGVLTSKPAAMDVVSVQQRPEKVSPCPRCESLDTKFCYYNNHNMKQPRHFCRRCQRYWTAGGALRNVPVGAGRRKHKTPLISTASKFSHPKENGLVGAAAGMCHPSTKNAHFLAPPHTDGARSHSFECVTAMSAHVGTDARQKEGDLGSLRHHTGAFYGVQKGTGQVQDREEVSSAHTLLGSHIEQAENQTGLASTPLPSPSHRSIDIEKMGLESSASSPLATDQKMGIAHPMGWLEQLGKASPLGMSESLQRAYGYGNASLTAWSHPFMWPWLMPYTATFDGSMCNNMDQAVVSTAWARAVTATAASILQTSPMWNPYGWGRDVNKSEGLSSLGKHPCSSLPEQEPLRVPKTLKIGDPNEAMHSSILMTLGLSSLSASSPASVAGFFNTSLQPKPDVRQHKLMVELPQHQHHEPQQWAHGNPAAQARSLAFQESG